MSKKIIFGERKPGNPKLLLREEQLNITKKWIQTGEVSLRKEVITEEKSITIPVTREELVIERKSINKETEGGADGSTDTIRIPIREEQIEVVKHPVILEDVNIYLRQFKEIRHVEETLKKEKVHIETKGDIAIKKKGMK